MSDCECKRCGRLIREDQFEFCDGCYERNRNDLLLIRSIIKDENIYDLATISKKSGISIKIINMLAKAEHIIFRN